MRSLIRLIFMFAVLGAAGCAVAPVGPPVRGYVYGPRVEIWGPPVVAYGPRYGPYYYGPYRHRYGWR